MDEKKNLSKIQMIAKIFDYIIFLYVSTLALLQKPKKQLLIEKGM